MGWVGGRTNKQKHPINGWLSNTLPDCLLEYGTPSLSPSSLSSTSLSAAVLPQFYKLAVIYGRIPSKHLFSSLPLSTAMAQIAQLLAALTHMSSGAAAESPSDRTRREERERFEAQLLSRSFLHLGTDHRGISRNIRAYCIVATEPQLDLATLGTLDNITFDMLTWHLYRVRPDTKITTLGVCQHPVSSLIQVYRDARERTIRVYGQGLIGIVNDFSNIPECARNSGFQLGWMLQKPVPKQRGMPQQTAPSLASPLVLMDAAPVVPQAPARAPLPSIPVLAPAVAPSSSSTLIGTTLGDWAIQVHRQDCVGV